MVDNTTQTADANMRTTDASGVHSQHVIVEQEISGTPTPVDSSNPLNITAPGAITVTQGANPLPVTESSLRRFEVEVALGNISGMASVVVRGHNPSQTSASGFVDVSEFGDLTYLSSAETMEIASADTNDTSAGTGLRTLLLAGVDGTGAAISETITMNGTTDVTSVNSYLRVNSMTGLTGGSVGWNIGNVTATATTAATVQCEMDATEGLSQNSHYTVPLGKTLYVERLEFNVAKTSGGSAPVVEFKGYTRPGGAGAAWVQLVDKRIDASVTDEIDVQTSFPAPLIARSDLRFRSDTDQNNTEVRTRFYGLLIDD